MNKNYALFDWDNTVRKGYTLFSWVDYLISHGILDEKLHKRINQIDQDYRNSLITHDKYAEIACSEYAKALKGIPVKTINDSANSYHTLDKSFLFHNIHKLFALLSVSKIDIIIISGAPTMVLNTYKQDLCITEIFGFSEETIGNCFSGKVKNNYGYNKSDIVQQLITKYHTNPVFAFGDSESDIPMLEKAKYSFCIGDTLKNPNYYYVKNQGYSNELLSSIQRIIDEYSRSN